MQFFFFKAKLTLKKSYKGNIASLGRPDSVRSGSSARSDSRNDRLMNT